MKGRGVHSITLRILGCDIRVSSEDRALVASVEGRYAPYLFSQTQDPGVLVLPSLDVLLERTTKGWAVMLEGSRFAVGEEACWPRPDDTVLLALRRLRSNLAFVHGSSVSQRERLAVFVGPSRHGKTTLACALSQQGWRLNAEDLTPLDLCSGRALPFLTTPQLRPPTQQIAVERGWHLGDAASCPEDDAQDGEVGWIFFLRGDSHEETGEYSGDPEKLARGRQTLSALEDVFLDFTTGTRLGATSPARTGTPSFRKAPALVRCPCSAAVRQLLRHMYQPRMNLTDLLVLATAMVARTETFYLTPGPLDETVAVVMRAARTA